MSEPTRLAECSAAESLRLFRSGQASPVEAARVVQQPACTIPCGLTGGGLSIGLQIVGAMFGATLVLRAALAHESASPVPHPPLAWL